MNCQQSPPAQTRLSELAKELEDSRKLQDQFRDTQLVLKREREESADLRLNLGQREQEIVRLKIALRQMAESTDSELSGTTKSGLTLRGQVSMLEKRIRLRPLPCRRNANYVFS